MMTINPAASTNKNVKITFCPKGLNVNNESECQVGL